jgi:hypothetical protein
MAEDSSSARKLAVPGVVLLLILLTVAGVLYRRGFFRSGLAATAFQNQAVSSLTSTGDVALVRISPDGRYLAYVSTKRGKYSLWVRQIAIASAVQIIPPDAHCSTTLSHDQPGTRGTAVELRETGLGVASKCLLKQISGKIRNTL